MDLTMIVDKLFQCEFAFIGSLDKAKSGIVSRSLPPIRNFTISFTDEKWIRFGGFLRNEHTFLYQNRDMEAPVFQENDIYIAGGHFFDGKAIIDLLVPAYNDELLRTIEGSLDIPSGWTHSDRGWKSPFPLTNPKPLWFTNPRYKHFRKCIETGRPALLTPKTVDLKIEQVRDDQIKKAPYGDGQFMVSVINRSDNESIEIESLLSGADDEVSWEDSLVVVDLSEWKTYSFPGSAQKPNLRPTILKPGELKQIKMNVLSIRGSNRWKVGGTRVYLRLCLGDLCATCFFYYNLTRHEQMHREQLGKPAFSNK